MQRPPVRPRHAHLRARLPAMCTHLRDAGADFHRARVPALPIDATQQAALGRRPRRRLGAARRRSCRSDEPLRQLRQLRPPRRPRSLRAALGARLMTLFTRLAKALLAYAVYEHQEGHARRIDLWPQPRSLIVQDDGRGMGLDRDGDVESLMGLRAGHARRNGCRARRVGNRGDRTAGRGGPLAPGASGPGHRGPLTRA